MAEFDEEKLAAANALKDTGNAYLAGKLLFLQFFIF
jgi:hypothetical protein